jgi:hypothetical protein
MRKSKYFIGLLILTSLFLSFIPFVNNVYALDDINFTFKNDVFYNNNSVSNNSNFIESRNVKNITTFTGIFNATDSFTNEVAYSDPTNIIIIDEFSGSINIFPTLDYHNDIVEFNDTSIIFPVLDGRYAISSTSGTIELWFRFAQTDMYVYYHIQDGNPADSIMIRFSNAGMIAYYDGSWNDLVSYTANNWIHMRIDFECGGGGYKGLGVQEFEIYINGAKMGANFDMRGNPILMDRLMWQTRIENEGKFYLDGIAFNWIDDYNINDNIVPLQNISSESLEVDKYTFNYESVGNTMPSGTDNPSGWTDIESGADRVNIALNESGVKEHCVEIYSSVGAEFNNSIFKDDFNLNTQRLNITFAVYFHSISGTLSRLNFEVKSLSNDLVIWIEIRGTGHLRWYTSNPPGTYNTLRTNFTTGVYYEFNIYIDYSADLAVLILKENLVKTGTFVNELVNIGKSGLRSIIVSGIYSDGSIVMEIDYIGIYDNGSSIANDLGYVVLDLHKDTHYLESTHNNLATINMSGNFELIYSSYIGNPFPIYLIDSTFGSITDGFVVMNENSRLFNFFDDGTIRYDPILVAFLNNGSKGFKFNSVILEGVKMTEGVNTYWLEYTHGNVLTNTSFFRVDNSNRLTFNLTTNDSDLEFIQANFDIDNIATDDRAVYFQSKKNNLAFAELRLLYPSVSDIIEIPNNIATTRTIISQNQTLTELIFLFSDNDITAISGITTGYIKNLRIIVISNLSTTIITLTLLGMIIPLVLIITPTFIFSNRLGKESVVPLFLIFSLIFTATETIPIWLFFIIAFSCLVFIFTNKDKMIK